MSGRLLICLPTYNEAGNIRRMVDELEKLSLDADLLFVDDASPDGTGEILEELRAARPRLHVLHRAGKLGIGSAHQDGIRWAYERGYGRLITMDCDLTHSPQSIASFLKAAEEADVVVGSRWVQEGSLAGWTLPRRLLTHAGHWATRTLLGLRQDASNAFRLYRLDRIPAEVFGLVGSGGYSFFFESLFVLARNGYRIVEVPTLLSARSLGASKMRVKDVLAGVRFLFGLWWRGLVQPERFLYLEPFVAAGDAAESEWDPYWRRQQRPSGMVYHALATLYRRVVLRPFLNHHLRRQFGAGARLLHAGCGSGQVDTDAVQRYRVTGLDLSTAALTLYRRSTGGRAELLHGSVFAIPAEDGWFDGVYNLGVMEHFTAEEIVRILREFRRVLRPGGRVVLFWPPWYGLSVNVLRVVHRFLGESLHPPEITHADSRRQMAGFCEAAGLRLTGFWFGPRDGFIQAVVVGAKPDEL